MTAAGAASMCGDGPPMQDDGTDIGPVGAAHVPVMVVQVVGGLRPRPGAHLVDGTVGFGGHAEALLRAAPDSILLGIDRDPEALAAAAERLRPFGDRVRLRHGSFARLGEHLAAVGWSQVDGLLLDLGVSSLQLDRGPRGFSWRHDAPLDMRMDPAAELTAATIVNEWSEQDLARILAECGEEPRARAVARAIVRARPLATTLALARVVAPV
ncbi:MAG TPA: 16S rRNA (cytosine(1402)-N(4))-methyltransferase RsmH, partial [Candidatus Limnocylindria bacterium]|nr:16S rRNA (cytosine(1402)-N(4))-methyltransferase RsmH [Candidatus Limnocylindria bacterium]